MLLFYIIHFLIQRHFCDVIAYRESGDPTTATCTGCLYKYEDDVDDDVTNLSPDVASLDDVTVIVFSSIVLHLMQTQLHRMKSVEKMNVKAEVQPSRTHTNCDVIISSIIYWLHYFAPRNIKSLFKDIWNKCIQFFEYTRFVWTSFFNSI